MAARARWGVSARPRPIPPDGKSIDSATRTERSTDYFQRWRQKPARPRSLPTYLFLARRAIRVGLPEASVSTSFIVLANRYQFHFRAITRTRIHRRPHQAHRGPSRSPDRRHLAPCRPARSPSHRRSRSPRAPTEGRDCSRACSWYLKPGAAWQVQPGGPSIPVPSFIWDYFKPFVDVRMVGEDRVDGSGRPSSPSPVGRRPHRSGSGCGSTPRGWCAGLRCGPRDTSWTTGTTTSTRPSPSPRRRDKPCGGPGYSGLRAETV